MKNDQRAYFLQRYRGLATEELVDLKAGDLTEVAREALNTVIGERGVKAEEVAKKILADDAKYALDVAEKQRAEEERKDRRDARYFKIGMCIFIPASILAFVFAPERAYGVMLIAIIQAVFWSIISGIVYAVRRSRRKKKYKSVVIL